MSGSFESLCGDFKALEATVRMHISEQHRVNENIMELLRRYDDKLEKLDIVKIEGLDRRIQATERRIAWYAGGIATVFGAWEFFKSFVRG